MKRKSASYFINFCLLILGVSLTVILFWIYSPPQEALSISPHPIPVVTKVVKEDGTCAVLGYNRCVVLKLTRCKNVRSTGRVVVSVVGKEVQDILPVLTDTGERKCENDVTIPFPIPPQTVAGTYHLHFRTTYKINPLVTVTQDFDTEEFTVE